LSNNTHSITMVAKALLLAALVAPASALAPAPKKPSLKIQAKAAVKSAAAAALGASLLLPTPAYAGRSGGRAGGGGMRRSAPMRSRPSGGGMPRGGTRMYAAPMVMPMPMGGMGMGMGGYGYGGGISPGAIVGLSILDSIGDEQRRQAYMRNQLETQRQLGKDQGSIDQLSAMIDAQDKRIAELQAQVAAGQK